MKKKKFKTRKLELIKDTIVKLNPSKLNKLIGGKVVKPTENTLEPTVVGT